MEWKKLYINTENIQDIIDFDIETNYLKLNYFITQSLIKYKEKLKKTFNPFEFKFCNIEKLVILQRFAKKQLTFRKIN